MMLSGGLVEKLNSKKHQIKVFDAFFMSEFIISVWYESLQREKDHLPDIDIGFSA